MVFASRQTNPPDRILSIVWMHHETAEQNQIVGPQMVLQHLAMVCRFTFLCLIGQHLADWPFDPVL